MNIFVNMSTYGNPYFIFKAMDKSWIMKPPTSASYKRGIVEFINFLFKDVVENGEVICPCIVCRLKKPQSRSVMFDHLKWSPFPKGYTVWLHYGESLGETSSVSTSTIPNIGPNTMVVEDPIQNMINDAFGVDRDQTNEVPIASNVEIDRDEHSMLIVSEERGMKPKNSMN